MSRTAYLDCVGGIAGDMLLAALLDAGGDLETLRAVPALLGFTEVDIVVETVVRHGLRALHVDVTDPESRAIRTWNEMDRAVADGDLPDDVRVRAVDVLQRLAEAEARVHGVAPKDVKFHELGAVDTLIDVCGSLTLLTGLGIDRVVCSPLPVARGLVNGAHGSFPLPAPATLELLRDAPVVGVDGDGETVTPTGAALVSVVASSFGPIPPLVMDRIGYGAGSADVASRPNVLRVLLSAEQELATNGEVRLLQTNLDDMNPELIPDAMERCFEAGALDVWTMPAQMKKGRPGVVVSVLTRAPQEPSVARVLLEQTSAIGLRVSSMQRYELDREEREVTLEGGTVRIKVARLDGDVVNVAPEHDDCAAIARATGRSVKAVWAEALVAAERL